MTVTMLRGVGRSCARIWFAELEDFGTCASGWIAGRSREGGVGFMAEPCGLLLKHGAVERA